MKNTILTLFATLPAALPVPLSSRNEIARRQAEEACPIGYCLENGGTTGGASGSTTTVTDLASLQDAAASDGPAIIIVSGTIVGSGSDTVDIASDKTIFGETGSLIEGTSLNIKSASNVILRNLKLAHVLYEAGDAISLNKATNVWIDHLDLSGDLTADKDSYDGLLDMTHASDWVTVSNSFFHNHWKTSLIGHADSNGAEDEGTLHVTFANNYWYQVDSRVPSVRFGTVHMINNYFNDIKTTGINARQKSQVLVQSSAFSASTDAAIFSDGSDYAGYVVVDDVDLGGSNNTAGIGTLTPDTLPYPVIAAIGSGAVADTIPASAGQLL